MKSEILIIDDETTICNLATRQLAEDNFFVTALSGGEGVEEALEEKKPFLVILDVNLPGRNGLDILKDIKSKEPELPVVMVSGHHNPAQAATACKMGACDYITKPIDWKYLRNIAYLYSFVDENIRS
jgi:DNA-binding NtrC family response regulator